MKNKGKAVVLGGGFAGCTAALYLKEKGFDVTVLEKSGVLGGGCRTYFYHGHPYTYGPHHIACRKENEVAWEFFNKHFELRLFSLKAKTMPKGEDTFFSFPPKVEDVSSMRKAETIQQELDELPDEKWSENFRDYWESSIGSTLYEMFVDGYSRKMWDIKNNNEIVLDYFDLRKKSKKLSLGSPTTSSDYYGAYPVNYDAYNPYFDLCAEGVDIRFNTVADAYDIPAKRVLVGGEWIQADVIINTVSPDALFEYQYGELKYMGREFTKIILPIERITPPETHFLHFAGDEPYTRIVEYKVFTGYESKETLIVIGYPSHKNKLYPYPVKTEIDKYLKYIDLLPDNVYSIGRMGRYRYEDMARIVADVNNIVSEL